MVTVSRAASALTARARSQHRQLPRGSAAAATIVAITAVLELAYRPGHLNYDARYAVLWARDLAHGLTPDYTAPFAPTPHPLQTAVSFLLLPFGDGADRLMITLTTMGFGVLVWLVYRLGCELHSPWVGAVAAAAVLTRPTSARFAVIGYQDPVFAALVVGAVLVELRRPRNGARVLAMLAVAGLMRPEAWLLSALYLARMWPGASPGRRAAFAALAVAAPVLWVAQDWVIAGDPLHSLHGTATVVEQKGRRTELGRLPLDAAGYLHYTLRAPLLLGIPIGMAFAWRLGLRRWSFPLLVAAVLLLIAMAQAVVGLPLIPRYLLTLAVLLTLFYGLAAFGWRTLPPGRERERWRILGVATLAASAVFLPWHARVYRAMSRDVANNRKLIADIRLVAEDPTVRSRFAACGSFSSIGNRPVPDLRYALDGAPGSIHTVAGPVTAVDPLLLVPRPTKRMFPYYANVLSATKAPPGYRQLYANDSWRVYAARACRTGRLDRPVGDGFGS